MPKILVVEDERKLSSVIARYLESEGFTVEVASDGPSGLAAVRNGNPSLVVLDLMLPGMNGLDVCREIRRTSNVPIIMLTARSEEADKLVGLEIGADDYITKPFSLRELATRVRAVLRRYQSEQARVIERLEAGDIELDVPSHTVKVRGQEVALTPAEFKILSLLMRNPGRVLTRLQILDAVFGDAFEGYERTVDTHILNLRKKVELDPSNPAHILTVYGIGYKMVPQAFQAGKTGGDNG
ncbi:MAG: response regulator transcription factor [Firmicutes bacterium]|nr:response regulator transcription factor [Bacillota bacterium]